MKLRLGIGNKIHNKNNHREKTEKQIKKLNTGHWEKYKKIDIINMKCQEMFTILEFVDNVDCW